MLKTVSVISSDFWPGSSGIWPLRLNCAVRKPPKKIVSSATWTAYAPRRFHVPRSPKTNVFPLFSDTLAFMREVRNASLIFPTASSRLAASRRTLALCSCPRSQCAEASSYFFLM